MSQSAQSVFISIRVRSTFGGRAAGRDFLRAGIVLAFTSFCDATFRASALTLRTFSQLWNLLSFIP